MIAYLNGTVGFKTASFAVIEVNNIGYKVYMPEKSLSEINQNDKLKVYTYMRVLDDDISLYGFMSQEELAMFELLISVGGIGAKSAISILSNIEPTKFAMAVITSDVNTLKKLPGIGPKTAGRIILELKDKIKSEDAIEDSNQANSAIKMEQNAKDAIEALQVLGYSKMQIENVINKIDTKDMQVEEIIKQGLKML